MKKISTYKTVNKNLFAVLIVVFSILLGLHFLLLDPVFNPYETWELEYGEYFLFGIVKIGLAAKSLGLDADDVVENGRLEHVVDGANVQLRPLVHVQNLPAAVTVARHTFQLSPAVVPQRVCTILGFHTATNQDLARVFGLQSSQLTPVFQLFIGELGFDFGVRLFQGVSLELI